jgi:N-methylhydantoinase B
VLEDVLGGFVSVDAARKHYGVVVSAGALDLATTTALRSRRPATRAFHRNEYVDTLA